jgi:hypothetical protein
LTADALLDQEIETTGPDAADAGARGRYAEAVLPEEMLRLAEELTRVDALDDPVFVAPFVPLFDRRLGPDPGRLGPPLLVIVARPVGPRAMGDFVSARPIDWHGWSKCGARHHAKAAWRALKCVVPQRSKQCILCSRRSARCVDRTGGQRVVYMPLLH